MMKKLFLFMVVLALVFTSACTASPTGSTNSATSHSVSTFRILMSDDLKPFEAVVNSYLKTEGSKPNIEITYQGISTIRNILQDSNCIYDAVWLSSSVPLNMVSGGVKRTNTTFTCVSPVVFAVSKSKAVELKLTGELSVTDLTPVIASKKLMFALSNVSQTNSGLMGYLGLVSGFSGNPTVLTLEHLENPKLQDELISLFSAVERSSGSDQFIAELIKEQGYNCAVSSEAMFIQLNRELETSGKETMRLLYPSDCVTMNDYPLVYIDKGNSNKLDEFLAFRNFVMGDEGRKHLVNLGYRTDLGGLIAPEHYSIFKEEWGIKTKEYIPRLLKK